MPTEKELLAATVGAAGKLFKQSKEFDKARESFEAAEKKELAQSSGSSTGETEPEE